MGNQCLISNDPINNLFSCFLEVEEKDQQRESLFRYLLNVVEERALVKFQFVNISIRVIKAINECLSSRIFAPKETRQKPFDSLGDALIHTVFLLKVHATILVVSIANVHFVLVFITLIKAHIIYGCLVWRLE
jgi:hypothetical protein